MQFSNIYKRRVAKKNAIISEIKNRLRNMMQVEDKLIFSAAGDSEFAGFDIGTTACYK